MKNLSSITVVTIIPAATATATATTATKTGAAARAENVYSHARLLRILCLHSNVATYDVFVEKPDSKWLVTTVYATWTKVGVRSVHTIICLPRKRKLGHRWR